MPVQHLESFMLSALALILIPGPAVALMLSRQRMAEAAGTLAGIVAGDVVHIGASALGLGLLLQRWPAALGLLQLLGAGYLLYLAWQLWPRARTAAPRDTARAGASSPQPAPSAVAAARQGLWMTLSNPKPLLFFSAFFPAFISDSQRALLAYVLLGLLFEGLNVLVFAGLLVMARRWRQAVGPSRRWHQLGSLGLFACALLSLWPLLRGAGAA